MKLHLSETLSFLERKLKSYWISKTDKTMLVPVANQRKRGGIVSTAKTQIAQESFIAMIRIGHLDRTLPMS